MLKISKFNLPNLLSVGKIFRVRYVHREARLPMESEEQLTQLLLSEESRQRLLENLQKAPKLYIKAKPTKEQEKSAAVLISLCTNEKGEVSILYTKRSGNVRRHVSQISFPGGIKDPTDLNYVDCALRETTEEIGLPRQRVEIWGAGPIVKPPYTAAIMPVIGVIKELDLRELKLNHDEVDEAFTVPISRLMDPSILYSTQFKTGYSVPVFVVENYRIWGITGYLTYSFLQCLLPPEMNRIRNRVRFVRPYIT